MTSQPEFILTFFISWMILDALGCSRMLLDIIYSVDAQMMLSWCSDALALWCSDALMLLDALGTLGIISSWVLFNAFGWSLMLLDASWILCIGKSFASKHLSIWGSEEHLNIWPFEHLSIWALKHLNIWAIEHFNIWSSDHLSIWASEHHILLNHNVCHLKTLAFEHWCILWSQNEFWLCSHFLCLMW